MEMKRELRITGDGSHTIFIPEIGEPYHSLHGAIQESMHVFICQGFHTIKKINIRILETGFGTGLNMLLTHAEASRMGKTVYYHTVEKHPLQDNEYLHLNYENFLEGIKPGLLNRMHEAPWGVDFALDEGFMIFKEQADFRVMEPKGPFDLVYFDAFDPAKQPYLWSSDIFLKVASLVATGGILVSYTAKGSVRRDLVSCGFQVEKVKGPPGKREMIRAMRC
jgi:tRNA U34 5-methylaminomethyl-2-thiouridine-forming methyltransferase MnmC